MKKTSESQLQSQAIIWYTNNYCLKKHEKRGQIFSVPNEIAMMIRGALKSTGISQKTIDQIIAVLIQRLKNTGMKPGVSDTVVMLPNGKTIFVEFKTATGVQSEKQKEFEENCKAGGHEYYLVRSLDEFKKIIYDKTGKY